MRCRYRTPLRELGMLAPTLRRAGAPALGSRRVLPRGSLKIHGVTDELLRGLRGDGHQCMTRAIDVLSAVVTVVIYAVVVLVMASIAGVL